MATDPRALVAWAEQRQVALPSLLAALARAAAAEHGDAALEGVALVADDRQPMPPGDLPLPGRPPAPDLLGEVLGVAAVAARPEDGAVFTPRPTADGLVRVALEARGEAPSAVLDPSVGGGAFVLAVARALHAQGIEPQDAVRRLHGRDTDALSVQVCEASLVLWCLGVGGPPSVGAELRVADVLHRPPERTFDLVVGNPPFQSQLRRSTARAPGELAALRERWGAAVGPYTDTASLFLLAGLDVLAEGGVLALVQPRSFLGAAGAAEVRRRLRAQTALVGLWEPRGRVFPVAVDVCAPVVVRGHEQPPEVRVWREVDLGEAAEARPALEVLDPEDGAVLVSGRPGGPPPVVLAAAGGRLGDVARVTAGFRDQFYGMAPHVREATGTEDPRPRLVTSGLLDPGRSRWGERPARIARRTWTAPVLEADELDPLGRVGRWVTARAVPKVVVASQTKVLEAALDPSGTVIPSPPTVSVEAPEDELPRLLAVLLSPATTAWLHRRAGGTGLAPGSLRVSRAQLAELPLPGDRGAWDEATALLLAVCDGPDGRALGDDAPTRAYAEAITAAQLVPPDVADPAIDWWLARLPTASLA